MKAEAWYASTRMAAMVLFMVVVVVAALGRLRNGRLSRVQGVTSNEVGEAEGLNGNLPVERRVVIASKPVFEQIVWGQFTRPVFICFGS